MLKLYLIAGFILTTPTILKATYLGMMKAGIFNMHDYHVLSMDNAKLSIRAQH